MPVYQFKYQITNYSPRNGELTVPLSITHNTLDILKIVWKKFTLGHADRMDPQWDRLSQELPATWTSAACEDPGRQCLLSWLSGKVL